MALVLKDRVKETSTTAGTGTITLAGAVAGFQSFSAVGNGNTTYYAIVDPTTGDWEVGIGTYTSSGTTLSRDTVLSSSNSGSLVSFVANQKDVFVTYPSEKSVYEDASNVVNATSFGAITATSAALTTGTVSTAPASGTDIANKTYVDTLVSSGITYHTPVKYEVPDSTGNLNATYNQPGGPGVGVGATLTNSGTLGAFTPDGTVATAGDRIIVYNQTNQFENGIYTVTTVGSGSVAWVLTRATDADTYALKSPNGLGNGDAFFITSGATGAGETYVCNTAGTITFGTTAITFAQISDSTLYTAGTGLTLTGTEFSITPTGTAGTYGSASSVPVLTTNASGQVTSVTNTTIAINGSQVSGNISGSAGSVANALTLGTYLTGGSFNGSSAVTATVDATSANTASKVVARDSSGNFSAGTITATLSGSATSATTATNLAGGAANQIAYQSAANTTAFATAPSASNQVLNWNGSAFTWSAGTISGVPLGSNLNSLTAGTYLTGTAYNGSAAQTWTVDATSANTASKVVARDASGNFSASTITATLSGNATSATNSTTTSQRAFSGDISTTGQGRFTGWNTGNAATGLATEVGASGGEGYILVYNRDTSTYGTLNIASSGANMQFSGSTINVSSGTLQQGGSQVLTAANYNSYAPTLTGTGASGTWGINITGSAGSAGSATTAVNLSGGTVTTGNTVMTSGWNRVMLLSATYPVLVWNSNSTSYSGIGVDYSGASSRFNFWINGTSADITGTGTVAMTMNSGNYVSATGSFRAPIFYDSDNTSYYVDPASTSNLASSITIGGRTVYTTAAIYDNTASGNNIGIAFGSGNILPTDGAGTVVNNSKALGRSDYTFSSLYLGTSAFAPIFYDSNNTGYYVDPASTSNLVGLTVANTISGSISGNSASVAGLVPAQFYNNMGNNHTTYQDFNSVPGFGNYYVQQGTNGPTGVTANQFYGFTLGLGNDYALSSYGSQIYYPRRAQNSDTYIYVRDKEGGSWTSWVKIKAGYADSAGSAGSVDYANLTNKLGGTGAYITDGSYRAPIFYDSDNTGYYLNPASGSNLNSVYTDNWFRTYGATGLYSQSYGQHFYPYASSGYWNITGAGQAYGGLAFRGNYEAAIKGWIYWDSDGFGFLCPDNTWGVRVTDTTTYLFHDTYAKTITNYNNTAYYLDTPGTSVMNNVQITTLGVGTAASGTTGEIRATNNVTAYYSSDIKFKTNVRDIPNAIETVESIGGKLFDWNDEYIEEHGGEDGYFIQKEDFGVIAQDVLKVFPVAVRTRPDGSLAVDYEKLSALAFAAVSELSTRVKSLEARI